MISGVLLIWVISLSIYYYLTSTYDYWTKRKVLGPKPSLFFGNAFDVVAGKKTFGHLMKDIYEQYPNEKIVGLYRSRMPELLVRDPELIKQILIKDFNNFTDRGMLQSKEILGEHLFNAEGDTWKVLRQKMSPLFSSGKIKNMFYLIENRARDFENYVQHLVETSDEAVEMRNIMSKYTLAVIGSCAFGIDLDTLQNEDSVFRKVSDSIFNKTPRKFFLQFLNSLKPGLLETFKIRIIEDFVTQFFVDLVNKLILERSGQKMKRHDFMDLLIDLKEQGHVKGSKLSAAEKDLEITDTLLTAQAFVFFAAGFETSSNAMTYALYELAMNPDLQEKAYQDIVRVLEKHNNVLTYEAILEMDYVDMVLSEALRKYTVAGTHSRRCTADYVIPGTDVLINKGVYITIPVRALHYDPQYFPEPEKFDPERFSKENRGTVNPIIYSPFGEGPRRCIAARFAKVQSVVGIVAMLRSFRVLPSDKTATQLSYDARKLTLVSREGIWLDIQKR